MEDNFLGQTHAVTYANIWRRLAAAIVDQIALSIANFVLVFCLAFALALFLHNAAPKNIMSLIINSLSYIIGIVSAWAYYAVMESSDTRATFGKMLLNIQVTSLQGEQVSFARATGRYWAKALFNFLCVIVSLVLTGIFCFALIPGFKLQELSGGGTPAIIAIIFAALGIFIAVSLIVQVAGVLAFFMMTSRKQMMHDMLAGTMVIKKQDGLGQIPN